MEIPFVQAKHYTPTGGRAINLIVIHNMQAPEKDNTAEGTANYFATTTVRASCHYNADNNSIVQSVRDKDIAWHSGHSSTNARSIGIEHAGYVAQSTQEWLDDYGKQMFQLTTQLTADLCKKYNIPVVWLSPAQVRAGAAGICGHADVTYGFNIYGGHTDPEPNFPKSYFIDLVKEKSGQVPVSPNRGYSKMIDIVTHSNGRAEEFRIINGKVNHRWQEVPNGGWSNYAPMQGAPDARLGPRNDPGAFDNVASFRNADGRIEVVAFHSAYGVPFRCWLKPDGLWTDWMKI